MTKNARCNPVVVALFFSVPQIMSTTASARNIYFCGSIRAGRGDADLYGRIVKKLETHGKVLTPFVADPSLTATDSAEGGVLDDRGIHDRDVRLLTESQAVVAEVTIPSHGVGYEIGRAVDMKRKILCLYRPQEGKSKIYFCGRKRTV
jgi:hypothetical protein